MLKTIIPEGAILFAPMEGVTDAAYRETVNDTCPGWDSLASDFLRVPAAGHYPNKHIIRHLGSRFFEDKQLLQRTMFQILSSEKSFTTEMSKQLDELGIPWIDMNLGCPSKTVCKSGGGSFLLKDLKLLSRIIRDVRTNFKGHFTCKIRVGWADGSYFDDTVKLLNDEGVEMITVHGRTREQMYKEPANWKWIAQAVKVSQVPVIGNGDVWCAEDAFKLKEETGCHAIMVARGALKTPWFPYHYKNKLPDTASSRMEMARLFLRTYADKLTATGVPENGLVRQLKGITRYMFDDLPGGQEFRRGILLSQTSAAIFHQLDNKN